MPGKPSAQADFPLTVPLYEPASPHVLVLSMAPERTSSWIMPECNVNIEHDARLALAILLKQFRIFHFYASYLVNNFGQVQ